MWPEKSGCCAPSSGLAALRICSHLTELYAVDPATCEGEVLEFLNQLVRERVINVADAA